MKKRIAAIISFTAILIAIFSTSQLSSIDNSFAPTEEGHAFSFDEYFSNIQEEPNPATSGIDAPDEVTVQVGTCSFLPAAMFSDVPGVHGDLSFTSSNPEVVEVVEGGYLIAKSEGTAIITITSSAGHSKTTIFNVKDDRDDLSKFDIYNKEIELSASETVTILTSINHSRTSVSWVSDNPSVASVDVMGNVTGISAGTATITGTTTEGAVNSCTVSVKSQPTGIVISHENLSMNVNDTFTLSAFATPEGLVDRPIIRWFSNNESVVSVTRDGLVTAITPGIAVITAKTSNDIEAYCTITVNDNAPTSFYIQNSNVDLSVNETVSLLTDIPASEIAWTSSAPSVASVDSFGNVTGCSAGTSTITGTLKNGYSQSAVINVKTFPTSVTISNTEITLKKNENFQLSAVAEPQGLVDRPVIIWSSSNENVATVDRNGLVTAVGKGTATIVAKTYNDVRNICYVNVTAPIEVQTIEVTPTSLTIEVGQTDSFTYKVYPENAENKTVRFGSRDHNIAYVDNMGNVYGVSEGTTAIELTASNGAMQTLPVTVKAVSESAESIYILCKSNAVRKDTSMDMDCYISPNTISQDCIKWSSSNPEIASIDESGIIRGHEYGSTVITAKVGKISCSRTITVISPLDPYIYTTKTYVELTPSHNVDCPVKIINDSGKITRSVSVENLAEYAGGCVVAKESYGITELTLALSNGTSTTIVANILPVYNATSILVDGDEEEFTLSPGDTAKVNARVFPAYVVNKELSWKSLSPSIATVDSNGNITAVSSGETQIVITAQGGASTTIRVIVKDEDDWRFIPNNIENNSIDLYVGSATFLEYTDIPEGVSIKHIYSAIPENASLSNGVIRAHNVGRSVIYGKLTNGEEAEIEVRVLPTEEYKQEALKKARQQVLNDVNKERAALGLKPYIMDETLNELAQIRADEMHKARDVSHTRPDGRKWSTVFNDAGVRTNYKIISENIIGFNMYPSYLVTKWMTSTAHARAIISDQYEITGIGIAFGDEYYQGAYCACELFAVEK